MTQQEKNEDSPNMLEYDYLIAGAGSAGCVLANRLSADPHIKVLLIEAGGTNRHPFVHIPGAAGQVYGNPKYDWGYQTEPQTKLHDRRIYWPRGRGYGGSSAINGMIFIRGNQQDYDGWRQLGLEGWAYADVLPYFKRAEGNATRHDHYHRPHGRLRTGPAQNVNAIDRMFLEAVSQSGLPANPDFNGASQIGGGIYDVSVFGGKRWTTANAYLEDVRGRSNLTVITEALVHRVLFEGSRASGIELSRHERLEKISARREVILSLGAIGSPQVLLLSGVGPGDELAPLGIDPIIDLPGVGRNLQDHLNVPVRYECTDSSLTFDRYLRPDRAAGLGLRYALTRGGPASAPFWAAGAFKSSDESSDYPDFQVFFTPMVIVDDPRERGMSKKALPGFQLDVNQMHPDSHGTLKLRSANPTDHPRLDPCYLTAEKDQREMIDAVKWARDLVSQPVFANVRGAELSPGASAQTDKEILERVAASANSGYHPTCTCKMGIDSDPMAVVDQALRLRGTENLRVVDASVMPFVVTGNTNAPTIMIAEKAADMILGNPALPREER